MEGLTIKIKYDEKIGEWRTWITTFPYTFQATMWTKEEPTIKMNEQLPMCNIERA